MDVQITGAGGVPASGVSAVVLNATVTNTTATSWLTAYPTGSVKPTASNVNWAAGRTVPNRVIVPVGVGGKVTFANANGSADLLIDVNGYFTNASASGALNMGVTSAARSHRSTLAQNDQVIETDETHYFAKPGAAAS